MIPTRAAPVRSSAHDALSVFLGEWRAEGMSFGGPDKSGTDPKATGVPWVSTHTARWHTGDFPRLHGGSARTDAHQQCKQQSPPDRPKTRPAAYLAYRARLMSGMGWRVQRVVATP